jgi:hypothetical protein
MICSGHKLRVTGSKVFQLRRGSKKDRGASKYGSSPNILNKITKYLAVTSLDVILSLVLPAHIYINFSREININVTDPVAS